MLRKPISLISVASLSGPDPDMLLPGGTESRSLEPSGESRAARGESERGLNPFSLGGGGPPPEKNCKICVSENAFKPF